MSDYTIHDDAQDFPKSRTYRCWVDPVSFALRLWEPEESVNGILYYQILSILNIALSEVTLLAQLLILLELKTDKWTHLIFSR